MTPNQMLELLAAGVTPFGEYLVWRFLLPNPARSEKANPIMGEHERAGKVL